MFAQSVGLLAAATLCLPVIGCLRSAVSPLHDFENASLHVAHEENSSHAATAQV